MHVLPSCAYTLIQSLADANQLNSRFMEETSMSTNTQVHTSWSRYVQQKDLILYGYVDLEEDFSYTHTTSGEQSFLGKL